MLASVCLEIVLILTQDRCKLCAECTIGSKIVLDAPMELLVTWVMWNLVLVRLETVLVSVQHRLTVCAHWYHRLRNHFGCTQGTLR